MVEVSTSLLNVKKEKIIDTIYDLEKAKTDYFHIDVMDGEFVKNDTHDNMLEYCEYLSGITTVPLDVHLMVKDVKNFIDSYAIFRPNIITFHYEACKDEKQVMELIKHIKEKNIRAGISIKPNTKWEDIIKVLPYIHLVLIMTVEPGEGGQEIITSTVNKVKQLREYAEKEKLDLDIEVDGGINADNAKELVDMGANMLVSGSYIINSKDYSEAIRRLKKC